ncbi:hypothetical protein [Methylocaldum gracile]|jgi:hypothetical protein
MTNDINNGSIDYLSDTLAPEVIQFYQTNIATEMRPQGQQMWGEAVQY